jgi:type II secretion system protein N
MAEKQLALWKRIALYSAFGFFSLFISVFLTFPYDALSERAKALADEQNLYLRIGGMGPGFFSVRATDLKLSKKARPNEANPPEPLNIDSVSVGPSLFPPGIKVTSKLLGGAAFVRVSALGAVKVELDDLDLSKGNMKGFSGMDLAGKLSADVALSMPRTSVGNGPPEPDLGQATGTVFLEGQGVGVNGGTVNMVIPMYGSEPTPLDLPKITVGDLKGKLTFDKGAGKIDELTTKSSDIEANASGTVKLAKRVEYSELAIELRFKPDPEFQKRLGLIGSALSMIGPDPKDTSWRLGRLSGFLGKPAFR